MKTVKVFIASSDELRFERLEIADMIQHLNRILKPRGVEIDPLDNHEEYYHELKNCEICLVLYWTRLEDYTKNELDTAYSELRANRNPQKLYVYFKDTEEITPELKSFKESFPTAYGHFFCRFENVDTMKLNFLLQFEDYQNKTSEGWLKVRNSRVEVDGQPFVELKNVPFAGNNPEYLQLLKQIESTQARVLKYPDDRESRQKLHNLQERCKAMESSLLDTAKLITQLSSTVTSARLTEAVRLFEAGDNKGARDVLNHKEIYHDTKENAARVDAVREIEEEPIKALEANVEEYRLSIKILQNTMDPGWIEDITILYNEIVAIARNRITLEKFAELLREYADFLNRNKQYHLVGTLYDEALAIYRMLAIRKPDTFNSDVAMTLNNQANLHAETQYLDKAEQEYLEALKIRRLLAAKHPETFVNKVAESLNNLANLYSVNQRYNLAETRYKEALDICNCLDENNSGTFEYKATLLHNLANLHYRVQYFNKAELEYNQALIIRRQLAEKYPDTYDNDLAMTLSHLANLHSDIQCIDKAELEYNEALGICRRIATKNPEAFDSDVAMTLNNLALLHSNIQRFDKAEHEFGEALEIYRRLAEKCPEAYDRDVATTLSNQAKLHSDVQNFDKAEQEYDEALGIFRRLAGNNPKSFERCVAKILVMRAILHTNTRHKVLVVQELKEVLDIYRRMTEYTDADAYKIQALESCIKELQEQ